MKSNDKMIEREWRLKESEKEFEKVVDNFLSA